MVQAERLFAELTAQVAKPGARRPAQTSIRDREATLRTEVSAPPPSTAQRVPDIEEVLQMLRTSVSAINERLAKLERILLTEGSSATDHEEAMPEDLRQPRSMNRSSPSSEAYPESDDHREVASSPLPVLGRIPKVSHWNDRTKALVRAGTSDEGVAAHAYRALCGDILSRSEEWQPRTIQVTSPLRGDGRSTTTANVAVTLAQEGKRVIVMCCDLRRPRLHELFGLPNDKGFTSVVERVALLRDVVQQVPGTPNLKLVASGPVTSDPSALLASNRATEIISVLQSQCDVLLIDSPPLTPVTDALAVSRWVQGAIIVVRDGPNSRGLVRDIEILQEAGVPLLGRVVNGISQGQSGATSPQALREDSADRGPAAVAPTGLPSIEDRRGSGSIWGGTSR